MTRINFLPQQHGFHFPNHFPGLPLPLATPAFLGVGHRFKTAYGLCGGMSSAALDYFLFQRSIPEQKSIPVPGSLLHRYLYRRQLDTYGFLGTSAVKFGQWMMLNDLEVQRRTQQELKNILQQLDQGYLVVIGLVYISVRDTLAIWINHQVLVYGHTSNPQQIMLKIYDPNYPQRDDIALDLRIIPDGLMSQQIIPGIGQKRVRGFFAIPYTPIQPPMTQI